MNAAFYSCRIDTNFLIKVSDFGLSETMDSSKIYFRQDQETTLKLPFKWLALESITEGVFSEKTDVVSHFCLPLTNKLTSCRPSEEVHAPYYVCSQVAGCHAKGIGRVLKRVPDTSWKFVMKRSGSYCKTLFAQKFPISN